MHGIIAAPSGDYLKMELISADLFVSAFIMPQKIFNAHRPMFTQFILEKVYLQWKAKSAAGLSLFAIFIWYKKYNPFFVLY